MGAGAAFYKRHRATRAAPGRRNTHIEAIVPIALEKPLSSPPPFKLTADEEITLRRVAFGQSEVRAMRREDLVRLRRLRLIEDAKDGPRLTVDGRLHFETLGRPSLMGTDRQHDTMMAEFARRTPKRPG